MTRQWHKRTEEQRGFFGSPFSILKKLILYSYNGGLSVLTLPLNGGTIVADFHASSPGHFPEKEARRVLALDPDVGKTLTTPGDQ